MKLMTKEIEAKMPPLYSNENHSAKDTKVIAKFFHPFSSWTWYATEGNKEEDGTYLFFGYVRGMENELGYFTERELAGIRICGLGIERDLYFGYEHTLAEVMKDGI